MFILIPSEKEQVLPIQSQIQNSQLETPYAESHENITVLKPSMLSYLFSETAITIKHKLGDLKGQFIFSQF